jgi:hypothetical protein
MSELDRVRRITRGENILDVYIPKQPGYDYTEYAVRIAKNMYDKDCREIAAMAVNNANFNSRY